MYRFHPLRWLALAIGLLSTQCLDSLSDDCAKTLTCGDEPKVTLDGNCVWRFPDGGVWEGGPQRDPVSMLWTWPDGKPTATQDFKCVGPVSDGGLADAGSGAPDCTRPGVTCDGLQVCDTALRRCVECLTSAQCAGNVGVGDAGADAVCDFPRRECVKCLVRADCPDATPICKADPSDSSQNECVQCGRDADCGDSAPVCDLTTNECTVRCNADAECSGSTEKPVCNVTRRVCVECRDGATSACTGATSQCNTTTNECVECIQDGPCSATQQVCDVPSNTCVQCRDDNQCATVPGKPLCDVESKTCVACLNDTQCTAPGNSRCNTVEHVCVGCNASAQCENGTLCSVSPQNPSQGKCVECLADQNCTGAETKCETVSGECVECLDGSQCPTADLARCETVAAASLHRCVGCIGNPDCAGKPGIGDLCRTADHFCVNCLEPADCIDDGPTASRCGNNGNCGPCAVDTDCDPFPPNQQACRAGVGCVECVNDTHCTGGEVCKVNNMGAAAGPALPNTCVQCTSNAQCTSPGASKCVDNACVPCTADGDCDIAGLGVCDAGTCVQCTGPKRTACMNNVCDHLNRECEEDTPVGSSALCEPCVSDAQCASNARCVQQTFAAVNVGFFCFPLQASGLCTRGFAEVTSGIGTIEAPSALVCLQRETTCPAFEAYSETRACNGINDDASCGLPGSCESGPLGFQCTISCISANDCLSGTCQDDLCPL